MRVLPLLAILALSVTPNQVFADAPLSCNLGLLKDLGWKIQQTENLPGVEKPHTCANQSTPVFTYNQSIESHDEIQRRSREALTSTTSRCLVNREYKKSLKTSIGKLIENDSFDFPTSAPDPRDPFIPPGQSWVPAGDRGYDIPSQSITSGIDALYTKPFVAECAAAAQIAQLALYTEHYGIFTDAMLQPRDVGIGIWPQYIRNPSMADKSPLFINSRKRKQAFKVLAELGKGAFYGQSGYIKPYSNMDYIDSIDNRGQNFVIVGITENAVAAIGQRERPLKELSALSRKVWKKYKKRLDSGEEKETLRAEMIREFETLDPFFSDIRIYVHPLSVRNFAYHLGRQFKWNPRTPFVFEVYEDYQSGYFFDRYIDYRLKQCQQTAYCRQIDRKHTVLTDRTGVPAKGNYNSVRQCEADIQIRRLQ